jgi:hypothetical protein
MKWILTLLLGVFMNMAYGADFTLTSTSFKNGDTLSSQYTCDGKDISPQLAWSGAPENTKSFALIVSDPDAPAGTWYHWVLFNIPADTHELAENIQTLPTGTIVGTTSFKRNRYNGPCPPKGKPHHYIFTLYALDKALDLPSADAEMLLKVMKGHVLASTEITGLYEK